MLLSQQDNYLKCKHYTYHLTRFQVLTKGAGGIRNINNKLCKEICLMFFWKPEFQLLPNGRSQEQLAKIKIVHKYTTWVSNCQVVADHHALHMIELF